MKSPLGGEVANTCTQITPSWGSYVELGERIVGRFEKKRKNEPGEA